MKILLGLPEYPPHHTGGGGAVFKDLAENYKRLGHEVVVIYGYYPSETWHDDIKEYTDESGIKFYQVPELPYPKSVHYLRTVMPPNLKSFLKLKDIIKKEKPDVAHLHGYGLIFVNILGRILERLGIEYIFTIHGYPESQNKSNFIVRWVWRLYIKYIMNRTLRKSKKITCVSDFMRNDSRNICKENSVTIYNGINFADYEIVASNIDIKEKHKISKDELVIFSLGRISEMKGFQEVIKIIPKIIEQGTGVRYLIAGKDDGYKKELEKLASDLKVEGNVEFIGFLGLEEKKQYINQCNIFAIPSLWEPFGLVALEGMIFNKIILTTNTGGLKEVLENYQNKILINDREIVKKVLTHKSILLNSEIFKKFDYNSIVELYINQLKKH